MKQTIIKPIAKIFNDFDEKFGIPRQSGRAPSVLSRIVFEPEYRSPDALRGIDGFSHLWLIFDFSLSHRNGFTPLVRPPRLGGNQKVGVFASRSPFRPNNLGLSSVKLVKISDSPDGQILLVSGADLLSGTPIYDIKPYLPFTDCHVDAVGGFADDKLSHSLSVTFDCDVSTIPQDTTMALKECLADDPRPSYQADERVYGMKFAGYNVKFSVKDQLLTVHSLEKF
ncbi:MAG: tRNA (N6-threonylcarbamoyladenosine(37)-N6)-methyltransferase TrmO [Clostridia bacterium]|nr:tRNA (N6-threonylcarbamoyladenosine(37)-N6)-methyltransferase TrmO [Clostridia bacterium]